MFSAAVPLCHEVLFFILVNMIRYEDTRTKRTDTPIALQRCYFWLEASISVEFFDFYLGAASADAMTKAERKAANNLSTCFV